MRKGLLLNMKASVSAGEPKLKTNSKKYTFHIAVKDDKGNVITTVRAEADTVRNALLEGAKTVSGWTNSDPKDVDELKEKMTRELR